MKEFVTKERSLYNLCKMIHALGVWPRDYTLYRIKDLDPYVRKYANK